jgi:hypothetical protein
MISLLIPFELIGETTGRKGEMRIHCVAYISPGAKETGTVTYSKGPMLNNLFALVALLILPAVRLCKLLATVISE